MQTNKIAMALIAGLMTVTAYAQPDTLWIDGFSHPESVIQHKDKLYVSNIGVALEPDKKDGDGFISKVDYKNGKIESLHFLPLTGKLHAPKGSAFIGDVLYVADIDRILGFNIRNRETVFELSVPGAQFLNDVVAVGGKLYVSATGSGLIYAVDVTRKTVAALPGIVIPGANGLSYNAVTRKLYCVGLSQDGKSANGHVYEIDPVHNKSVTVQGYQGFLDGVAVQGSKLYFSDWKVIGKAGILEIMDLKSHSFEQVPMPDLIAGPADFTVSKDRKYFIIPVLLEGKVLYKRL
jgi:hypothetical protein